MGSQIRNLIGVSAVIGMAGFSVWYLAVHRPSADVVSDVECADGTATCLDGDALTGSSANPADFDDGKVVLDAALGLRLARLDEVQAAEESSDQTETAAATSLTSYEQLRAAVNDRLNVLLVRCSTDGSGQATVTQAEQLESILLQPAATHRARIIPSGLTGFDAEFIGAVFRRQQEAFDVAARSIGLDPEGEMSEAWVFIGIFQKNLEGQSGATPWSITGIITSAGEIVAVQEAPARLCTL